VIKKLRTCSRLFFDVHLMIQQPERYINQFVDAGADLICVHAESTVHLERTVSEIRRQGCQCGVALNPATPLEAVSYLLPQLDMVLIMSVNPGFGGQSFIPFSRTKISQLSAMIKTQKAPTLIQVDGGVSLENAGELVNLGAHILVSGSAFFKFPPYAKRYRDYMQAMNNTNV
jgi:ribulose-phosphate 3-epimerase